MSELFEKLGINWKLLIAQAVNFLAILAILRFTVYKPLLRMLAERRTRIAKGLDDAKRAGERLERVESERKDVLARAEQESIVMLAKTETRAKEREAELIEAGGAKEGEILKTAEKVAAAKKLESEEKVYREAATLVKRAIEKTISRAPKAADEALIAEALESLKKAS